LGLLGLAEPRRWVSDLGHCATTLTRTDRVWIDIGSTNKGDLSFTIHSSPPNASIYRPPFIQSEQGNSESTGPDWPWCRKSGSLHKGQPFPPYFCCNEQHHKFQHKLETQSHMYSVKTISAVIWHVHNQSLSSDIDIECRPLVSVRLSIAWLPPSWPGSTGVLLIPQ
jgi:hypothetical protein